MAGFVSPTVRRRRLAAELRRMRDRSGLRGEDVAAAIGWSPSKVSRYELARTGLKIDDVQVLLDYYHVAAQRQYELLALAREGEGHGWWEDYADVFPDDQIELIGLETEAASEFSWHLDVVPGLLQTETYARKISQQAKVLAPSPPGKIERSVQARLRRQDLLYRDPPFHLYAVIDESVLCRRVGGPSVMREQLAHLVEAGKLPNVSVRILRLADPSSLIINSFDLLRFGEDEATMLDIAWIEHVKSAVYVEGETDTFQYQLMFEAITESSLEPEDSMDLIETIARRVWS